MEEFEAELVVTRTIYRSGKVVYKGAFKTFKDHIVLGLDDAKDLEFLNDFAYEQLKRKILNTINKRDSK